MVAGVRQKLSSFINSFIKKKWSLVLIVVIAAGALYYFLLPDSNNSNSDKSDSQKQSLPVTEDIQNNIGFKRSMEESLKAKDYSNYLLGQTYIANEYIDFGKFDKAQVVLDEAAKQVPEDKLIDNLYFSYIELYIQKKDDQKRKEYIDKFLQFLAKNGRSSEVEKWKKEFGVSGA